MDRLRSIVSYAFLPSMLAITVAGVGWIANGAGFAVAAACLSVAIALSFAGEAIAPFRVAWRRDHGDRARDVSHALVNELLHFVTLALLPALTPWLVMYDVWPSNWPFAAQMLLAVIGLDCGVTLCHWASHRVDWLWRFHAVHHSVERMYGFNGLMKHPVHQALETAAGALPMVLFGLPETVAVALVYCVSVQLLLQHSNTDYAVGRLRCLAAWNATHRFHHLREAGAGDVNFGLFTNVWDHLLGTYAWEEECSFADGSLGITDRRNYPVGYWAQLREPFRRRSAPVL